jgi:hypothetical protein
MSTGNPFNYTLSNYNKRPNRNSTNFLQPTDDYYSYLRNLQLRSTELSNSLARIQLRIAPQQWAQLLNKFTILINQFQALYEEFTASTQYPTAPTIAKQQLIQPLAAGYNPATQLRIKSIPELTNIQQTALYEFITQNKQEYDNNPASYFQSKIENLNEEFSEMKSAAEEQFNLYQQSISSNSIIQATAQQSATIISSEEEEVHSALRVLLHGKTLRSE